MRELVYITIDRWVATASDDTNNTVRSTEEGTKQKERKDKPSLDGKWVVRTWEGGMAEGSGIFRNKVNVTPGRGKTVPLAARQRKVSGAME